MNVVSLVLVTIITISVLLGFILLGYFAGLKGIIKISRAERKEDGNIFTPDRPQSWDLDPEDIDNIDEWSEFEDRID